MHEVLSPSDFVVAEPFRWRGVLYEKNSGLPSGIPQGAISQFLRRTPPLIKLKGSKAQTSANGTGKKTTKKAASRKASSKKTSKKKATKKASKKAAKKKASKRG